MSQNSSCGHYKGQGQGRGHLGHMTPRWTRLLRVHRGLSKRGKSSVKMALSLQIRELHPKNRFTASNSKRKSWFNQTKPEI